MRGISLARAANGGKMVNPRPQMVGGTGMRSTNKKKKKKKKKPATDAANPQDVRQQADGESRGRNSTEPPSGPPGKPKIGFVTTDYSELDDEPSYNTKKTAQEIALTLPKSPAPRTPGRGTTPRTPGRTTPGRRTPSAKNGNRRKSSASRSPLPRSPSLPGCA